jgi:hypothetical protein
MRFLVREFEKAGEAEADADEEESTRAENAVLRISGELRRLQSRCKKRTEARSADIRSYAESMTRSVCSGGIVT